MIFRTAIVAWCFVVGVAEGALPLVKIAPFRGDARAAVSLTFDDALNTQIEKGIPVLESHGVRATFFLQTGNVRAGQASNWDAWKAAASRGQELGSHSQTHPRLTQIRNPRQLRAEIEGSAEQIEHHTGFRPLSFSYPFSDANDAVRRKVRDVYVVDRSDCRMWGGETFTVEEAIRNIDQAVTNRTWFVAMLHGVDDDSFRSIDADTLDRIAAYLADRDDAVWTDTYGTVGRYVKARNFAMLRVKTISPFEFRMRLALPADLPHRDRLSVPLTVKVELDGRDAKLVKAYQGDTALRVTPSPDGQHILLDIRPDGDWIQMFWDPK